MSNTPVKTKRNAKRVKTPSTSGPIKILLKNIITPRAKPAKESKIPKRLIT